MVFPVGTVGRRNFRAYVTFGIVAVNIVMFLIEMVVMAQGESAVRGFFGSFALAVCSIGKEPVLLTVQRSVGTMFLHANLPHILFNMIFLWIFAPRVEEFFGHKRFLIFYLLVGTLANIAHVLLGGVVCHAGLRFTEDMMVGASGAIAGIMGAFLYLFPGSRVRTLTIFIFPKKTSKGWSVDFFRILSIPAFLYLILWVVTDISNVLKPTDNGVAHWAHIGGFFGGVALMFVVTMFMPAPAGNPLEHLDT